MVRRLHRLNRWRRQNRRRADGLRLLDAACIGQGRPLPCPRIARPSTFRGVGPSNRRLVPRCMLEPANGRPNRGPNRGHNRGPGTSAPAEPCRADPGVPVWPDVGGQASPGAGLGCRLARCIEPLAAQAARFRGSHVQGGAGVDQAAHEPALPVRPGPIHRPIQGADASTSSRSAPRISSSTRSLLSRPEPESPPGLQSPFTFRKSALATHHGAQSTDYPERGGSHARRRSSASQSSRMIDIRCTSWWAPRWNRAWRRTASSWKPAFSYDRRARTL